MMKNVFKIIKLKRFKDYEPVLKKEEKINKKSINKSFKVSVLTTLILVFFVTAISVTTGTNIFKVFATNVMESLGIYTHEIRSVEITSSNYANAWNPTSGRIRDYMTFGSKSDLSCQNETDKFSTLNEKAKLKYKVGLMNENEMRYFNNSRFAGTGVNYWLGSPRDFHGNPYHAIEESGGYVSSSYSSAGIRTAISLIPNIEYSSGDGSKENSYVIYTEID